MIFDFTELDNVGRFAFTVTFHIGSVHACKDSWHAYLRLIDGNQICLEKTSMFTLSVFQNTAILL